MKHKFSNQYRTVLRRAQLLAQNTDQSEVAPNHLLQALVTTKGSIAFELMHKLGLVAEQLSEERGGIQAVTTDMALSVSAKKVIKQSVLIAAQYDHQYVSTEHLLQGLVLEEKPLVQKFLKEKQYRLEDFDVQLSAVIRNTSKFKDLTASFFETPEDTPVSTPPKKKRKSGGNRSSKQDSLLSFFATELTSSQQQDRIKPVIGRDVEISRIVQILARLDKNNPVLLGQPGVGKTAIIEGLAKRIVSGDVPEILLNKRIYSLDISLLVAGAMYRGEFESRLKQLMDEIREDDDIILFIDEIHNLVGAGSATGTMDAANILKPALARGEVRLIGATTFDEFKKHIEPDAALERRLQPVVVTEPSAEETLQILKGIRDIYERHHGVKILNEAIEAATNLSHRYLTEKNLPDKAIDLIDEAAAKIKVKQGPGKMQKEIRELEQQLKTIAENKRDAVESENFPHALALKDKERELLTRIDKLESGELGEMPLRGKVDAQDIADLIAETTGIPAGELLATEMKQLRNLSQRLEKRVIGQDEAIHALAQAIKRSKTGLGHPDRPLGSFMFLGPSGVGKTETAKALAEEVFGSKDALIRFDMSEFAEGFNVSRLIGSPAGYVGYREGGQLTEAVRRRPYSVVLFDEIEKAHREIFNILLQILDEGHLADASGRQVDFKHTIIILTSNIGLSAFNKGAEIGFGLADEPKEAEKAKRQYNEIKSTVMQSLRRSFRPEFLNRLDKVVVFKPLTVKEVKKIVSLELGKFIKQAKQQKLTIKTDAKLVAYIAKKSFTPHEGARAIRRTLQDLVIAPLADTMLEDDMDRTKTINITVEDNSVVFNQ